MTFIFVITWVVLLVYAVRLMARGYTSNYIDPGEESDRPSGTWTTQVKKPVHPEMIYVKPGEELMGVTFQKEVPPEKIQDPRFKLDSPELHNLTPPPSQEELHQSLRDRIDELNDDDEDEDDGGDLVVVRR